MKSRRRIAVPRIKGSVLLGIEFYTLNQEIAASKMG